MKKLKQPVLIALYMIFLLCLMAVMLLYVKKHPITLSNERATPAKERE